MPEYNLGTARGRIIIDAAGAEAGAAKAGLAVESINRRTGITSKSVQKLGTVMAGAGLVVAAGFGLAVKSASDFEHRMSAIGAVTGATAPQLDALRQKALQLGKDSVFSAGETANAIEELAKNGLSVGDIMNGAADATVNLAAAGQIDLPQAAEIASAAMNHFGLSAAKLPHVADLLVGAADRSAATVNDLGESLKYVGPIANTMGLSIDDTTVALAQLAKFGIKGSMAGTTLRQMFIALNPQTDKAKNLMKQLGIITADGANQFFDAHGKIKSLADVSQVLQDALKGQTKQQQVATLTTLFGSRALSGAAILAQGGAKDFNKLATSIHGLSAADQAKERMDNLSGSLEQMKGSLETAGIQIGTVLLPSIRRLVDGVTGLVNKFIELSPQTQKIVLAAIGIAGGMLLAAGTFIKVTKAVSEFNTGIKAVNGGFKLADKSGRLMTAGSKLGAAATKIWTVAQAAFNAVMDANPIILIIAAIVLLVVAFVLLYKHSKTFRDFINGMWAGIQAAAAVVVAWFMSTVAPAFQAVWDVITTGLRAVQTVVGAVVSFIMGHWRLIVPALLVLLGPIGLIGVAIFELATHWRTVWNALKIVVSSFVGFFTGIWSVISTVISVAFGIIQTIITTSLAVISAIWHAVWGTFGPLITAIFNLIVAIIQLGIAVVLAVIRLTLDLIRAVWTRIWNGLLIDIQVVWAAIKTVVSAAVAFVSFIVTTVFNALRGPVAAAWNYILSVISNVIHAVLAVVTAVVNAIRNAAISGFNAVRGPAAAAWNAVYAAISGAINRALGVVASVVNAIRSAAVNGFNAVKAPVQAAWNALAGYVRNGINAAMSVASSIRSRVMSAVSGASSWLYNAGRDIIQGLINGIEAVIGSLTSKITHVAGLVGKITGLVNKLGSPSRLMYDIGILIMQGLINGIAAQGDALAKTVGDVTYTPSSVNPAMIAPQIIPAPRPSPQSPSTDYGNSGAFRDLHVTVPQTQATPEEIIGEAMYQNRRVARGSKV